MNDPFELWRLLWSTAMSRGLEHIAEAFPTAALSDRGQASSLNLSTFPTFDRVRIELQTMLLLERRRPTRAQDLPVLIVAPYAVHDASIADFAEGHSLARVLADGGPGVIALTSWKSASAEMRGYGIDAYLSDLNVAIDDLGGRVSLVGLCQGGWLAAAFAARFPKKVAKLVLAGAPIDLAAAESQITRTLASVPPATIVHLVALGGGMVSGALSFTLWSDNLLPEFTADAALQCAGDAALVDKFNAWNERTVDLPGAYFVQTAEWIFRENRLARERLPALGRLARLTKGDDFVVRCGEHEDRRLNASRRRLQSSPFADQRRLWSASNPGGTCPCSWDGGPYRPHGATSRIGSTKRTVRTGRGPGRADRFHDSAAFRARHGRD